MKYIYIIIVSLFMLSACNNDYNDDSITDRITDFQKRIEALQAKVEKLNEDVSNLSYLTNGNVITSVAKNSDGKYIITYLDANNEEKAVIVATQDDIIEAPILGVRLLEDDNLYYWSITIDGETSWLEDASGDKVPVYGHTPEISVNADGYWVVDNTILKDGSGNPINATTYDTAIFKNISKSNDGYLTIELGNGETLTLEIFDSLNLTLNTEAITEIATGTTSLTISYSVKGSSAEKAIISINQAEGVKASINRDNKTITVNFETGFDEGHIIVSAYDLEHLVLRPILFKQK